MLGTPKVMQAVDAPVNERSTGGQAVLYEHDGATGHKDLPTWRDRQKRQTPVERRSGRRGAARRHRCAPPSEPFPADRQGGRPAPPRWLQLALRTRR